MEPTRDFEALSTLISAQLTRGVATNTFLTPEVYRREIEAGTLMHHVWPGGLVLLRKRPGFQILNYYLQQTQTAPQAETDMGSTEQGNKPEMIFPDLEIPSQTVLELPVRPGREEEAHKALLFWKTLGFSPLLKRVRLVRLPGVQMEEPIEAGELMSFEEVPATNVDVSFLHAADQDLPFVQKLLERSFDRRTACLPTTAELQAAIAAGHVIQAVREDGEPVGVVHFKCTPAIMEIRHLAVHSDSRGQGLARRLVRKALEGRNAVRAQVWTGADNVAAQGVYTKCGYTPDGWTSEVWMKP